ncbi:MAG: hypothetical protein ICV79_24460 [Flavisolibacter sp.]|nr:hypothetical protein [Flavisolibacter sp.]
MIGASLRIIGINLRSFAGDNTGKGVKAIYETTCNKRNIHSTGQTAGLIYPQFLYV